MTTIWPQAWPISHAWGHETTAPAMRGGAIAFRSFLVMFKLTAKAGAIAAIVLAAQASPAQAVLGPDAAACRGNGPALLVNVDGFKARTGNIRVNVYGSDASRFLERGQYIRRIDLRVTRAGTMPICVSL